MLLYKIVLGLFLVGADVPTEVLSSNETMAEETCKTQAPLEAAKLYDALVTEHPQLIGVFTVKWLCRIAEDRAT